MYKNIFGSIRQWGFLVKDLDASLESWVKQLGVGPWWGYRDVRLTSDFQNQTTEVVIDVALGYQNGVQIELIQQKNDARSPYRAFYDTPQPQVLQQFGYLVPDIDLAIAQGKAAGLREFGQVRNDFARYVYLQAPIFNGMVVELMLADPHTLAEYERCAKEAAAWDGRDPYRWIGT